MVAKTVIESEDYKRGASLGVAIDSDSTRSSSSQRKSLVPAPAITGTNQRYTTHNSAGLFGDDHSSRKGREKGDKLPALPPSATAPRSSVQSEHETQQINLFWQQAAKWGSLSPSEYGWGPLNNGKIQQRRESVLVLPKIEPKPVARRSIEMPSID